MDYCVEIYDTGGCRVAVLDEVPLLEATRAMPTQCDTIAGMLPAGLTDLGLGYRVRVYVDGEFFCEAPVTRVAPHWGDSRKLILDRYVSFHEVIEFEAEGEWEDANPSVAHAFTNRSVSTIAADVINRALGPIHYTVQHGGYPEGAEREYAKLTARMTPANELEVGGISAGQWVGSGRIDTSTAYAKDGDTIAGLVVDGAAWPDLRLMMIDCEETSRNSHAIKRHPEVAGWTSARYEASGYKLRADAATQALQALINGRGIDYIELNPHQSAGGEFDDRVDAYGRYIGMVYGSGQCFNAAMVEQGHADVYLYEDGQYHVPEMELKDFFSYAGVHEDSVQASGTNLLDIDVRGGVLEVLTALAYVAGGYVWSVTPDWTVSFRRVDGPDRVVMFDPVRHGIGLGARMARLVNRIRFYGNPVFGGVTESYAQDPSVAAFGEHAATLSYYSIRQESDAALLASGVLVDLAYPEPCGYVEFHQGDGSVRVGDVVEVRGGDLRRLEREIDGEWRDRFRGRLVGRVRRVTHRFSGREVTTTAWLTSPFRSVENPLWFMTRGQDSASGLFQFRLDDESVGLDMGYHLD